MGAEKSKIGGWDLIGGQSQGESDGSDKNLMKQSSDRPRFNKQIQEFMEAKLLLRTEAFSACLLYRPFSALFCRMSCGFRSITVRRSFSIRCR